MADSVASVLDTFALLAYLQGESHGAGVREILQSDRRNVYMSLINVGEVLYITERKLGIRKAQEVLAFIYQLPIELLPADEQAIFAAAHIKANYPVSYADSFAIAAAQTLGGTVITGDPEFESVTSLITVEWLKE
ncbi:MAG TPA: type II toxin-antitoxin system VapC family toxin [Anaerolineales bacterium]|nr:type II toxin-antitoxin system VapC family toxin [Anaerolineales bacterium]